jgi:hypothetical protein
MSHVWISVILLPSLIGCSGAESSRGPSDQGGSGMARVGTAGAQPDNDTGSDAENTEVLPLGAGAPGVPEPGEQPSAEPATDTTPGRFVTFVDATSGFRTSEVHDADREVVFFDPALEAMVWGETGDAVAGWNTSGSDLSWNRSGIAFQVRFGTEDGERRAYFTEADRATICDLSITAPDALAIRATSETPPAE